MISHPFIQPSPLFSSISFCLTRRMAKLLAITLLLTLLASLLKAESDSGTVGSFQKGKFSTTYYQVEESDPTSPPKPLLIVTPIIQGTYPVVLFLHGTCLSNSFYTDLLQHVSSHGYIVVAPQVYICILFHSILCYNVYISLKDTYVFYSI